MIRVPPGRWTGLDNLGDDEFRDLRPRAEAAVRRAVIRLTAGVQLTLTGARHGRVYRVSKTGRLHVASAPGEAPAVLYGRLRQSIAWTEPTWEGNTVSAEVGTNVEYARRLEWGGVDGRGVRLLPRPYMEPTVQRMAGEIAAILEGAFE